MVSDPEEPQIFIFGGFCFGAVGVFLFCGFVGFFGWFFVFGFFFGRELVPNSVF